MKPYRFGHPWRDDELEAWLEDLRARPVNFHSSPENMTPGNGWTVDGTAARIGAEAPGPPAPGGPFERARHALVDYAFSDPRMVRAYFDPNAPLVGRDMLLEIQVLGFRFLNGVRVHGTLERSEEDCTEFGFRYDTLEGHIERGIEWFVTKKDHETGEIRFSIEAHWRTGDFPSWWSEMGFRWLSPWKRRLWRNLAVERMEEFVR